MSMIHDLELVLTQVLPIDPSFRVIGREEMDRCISDARRAALADSKDDFLLSLMRLMALPRNGHTRLIPNDAISVLPMRFLSIGSAVHLVAVKPALAKSIGDTLIAINGAPVRAIETAADQFLSGTGQRQRVIGSILFAWPKALERLGFTAGSSAIEYTMQSAAGHVTALKFETTDVVTGSIYYPRNEHGKPNASWSPDSFVEIKDFDELGLLISLPSFFDPCRGTLSDAMFGAARRVRSQPDSPLVIDLRGNTGGDFLKTLPLLDAITNGGGARRVGLLVDKFTFSAAIVFAALLKHRLGERLELIGEEMGDGLTFFAEGGSMELPDSGAVVRYSSAFHDWASGRVDETTPTEIAERVVPVRQLDLDRRWVIKSTDTRTFHEFCRNILSDLNT